MAGTSEGARRAAETNKQRDPEHYQKIGRKGGIRHVPKGYSMQEPEERVRQGTKGGRSPRKPKPTL